MHAEGREASDGTNAALRGSTIGYQRHVDGRIDVPPS